MTSDNRRSEDGQLAQPPGPRPVAGFLVIGRKRPGFDPQWAGQMERAAWSACQQLDLGILRPSAAATDDPSLRRAIEELRRGGCQTLVILQPTMGDGRLAPVLAQLWPDPVVFWATPERPDGGKVSSCSLVGAHAYASIRRQLGRAFELVYGPPEDEKTGQALEQAVRLTSAAWRLRQIKLGLVGYHAPGFLNMHADPAALSSQLGVALQHFGMHEFVARVEDQPQEAVQRDVDGVLHMGLPLEDGTGPEDLVTNSRYYLAIRSLAQEENLDAVAIRCWPELPDRLGAWPYLAMARLAEEHYPVALEGDVDGALSCLMGGLLGIGIGYISDWLEHDQQTITLWHPGHAPRRLLAPGSARLGRHFNTGHPLVLNATLAPNRPVTLFRLWRCDGAYRMTGCQAHTAAPRRTLAGASGLVAVEDRPVPPWFDFLCHQGMPHHVIVFSGHHVAMLKRFSRLLGIPWIDGP